MSKRKGKTGASRTADQVMKEANHASKTDVEAKAKAQAADAYGAVLSVDQETGSPVEAGEHVAASQPADLDGDLGIQVMATEPDDDRGSQISVLGGSDGQAAQADGGGEQDPAAPGDADPDGNAADHSAAPAGGDLDLHATTDAMVWAKEFIRITQAGDFEVPQLWDPGYMVGWFANAIETGRSAGLKSAAGEDLEGGDLQGDVSAAAPARSPEELRVETAWTAASIVFGMPSHGWAASDGSWLGGDDPDQAKARAEAAAAYVRAHPVDSYGPQTLVIHLRRAGFKDVPEPNGRASAAWSVFITALCELDWLAGQEDQAKRDAEASAASVEAAKAFGEGLRGRGPFAVSKGGPFDPTGFRSR